MVFHHFPSFLLICLQPLDLAIAAYRDLAVGCRPGVYGYHRPRHCNLKISQAGLGFIRWKEGHFLLKGNTWQHYKSVKAWRKKVHMLGECFTPIPPKKNKNNQLLQNIQVFHERFFWIPKLLTRRDSWKIHKTTRVTPQWPAGTALRSTASTRLKPLGARKGFFWKKAQLVGWPWYDPRGMQL